MIITYAQAISSALEEEMGRDKQLTLIGEDIGQYEGVFKATKGLFKKFGPDRVKDTPISEQAIIGAAIGTALLGYRVVAEIMYIDFATLASDQIINYAAKIHYMSGGKQVVPIVIRTQQGAGIRNAGQHSQSLEAWYAHIPGLKVLAPSTPYNAKGLLKAAIRDDNPVLFIEHKKLYKTKGEVPDQDYLVEIGKADVKREGGFLTIIAYSRMVSVAEEVSDILYEKYGKQCEVIDLQSISPIDADTVVNSVKKTGNAAVLHEACTSYGAGGEISSIIQEQAFDWLDSPVLRIGAPDTIVPFSSVLEDSFIPSPQTVLEKITSHFGLE